MLRPTLLAAFALAHAPLLFATEPGPAPTISQGMQNKPFPHISWRSEDGDASLDVGGALRANYRYEDWDSSINRPARWLFDTFRLDVQGRYQQFSLDAGYWFQDRNKRAVDRAYLGYRFDERSDLQVGAPARPFGLLPYPQFGWSYHIPFFLGFGVNTGTGLKYGYKDNDWDFQAAYYPRMLPSSIRYAPEVGRYADLKDNAIPALHGRQDNEKRDQVNLRLARSFQAGDWNNELGASLAASRLYNATTDDNGSFWAAGAHGVFKNGPWTISTQAIRYEYDPKNPSGVSDDSVLMGGNGLTPAFLVAAKGSIGGLNVGYDVATPWLGPVKKVKLYNDYSRLWKDKSGWDDSQMYTAGIQFFALPVMAWLDFTWARNANPWGGAENGTGWTSTTSSGSNDWYFRTNLNIGYYF
ncbi:hypothetical protein QA447_03990 [Pseudomonas sp. abacavir_1]